MVLFNYLLMCFIFGTTFLVIKVGVDAGLPPFFSAGLRFFLAGIVIFLWMWWKNKVRLRSLWRTEYLITGLLMTFITFATLYWAEQHIASGIAAVLSATGPLMILGMQTLFLRQASSFKVLIGCVIGFIGVLVLLLPSLVIEFRMIWVIGCVVVLLGEVGYAAGTMYSRRVVESVKNVSPIAQNSIQMMYGGAGLLVLSMVAEQPRFDVLGTVPAWSSLLYLIIVGSMVGHSLYYWLLSVTNAVFPSTWLYVSPIIALIAGALWYDEHLSFYSLVGALLVLSGVGISNLDALKRMVFTKLQRGQG